MLSNQSIESIKTSQRHNSVSERTRVSIRPLSSVIVSLYFFEEDSYV